MFFVKKGLIFVNNIWKIFIAMKIEIKGNKTTIEETEDSPAVLMDLDKKIIIIEGPSFPEDAIETYKPIINWLNTNNEALDRLSVIFDYSILSSASNKMVYEILLKLESLYKKNNNVTIKWYYESYDEDMKEEGLGFKSNIKVPFEILSKEDDF